MADCRLRGENTLRFEIGNGALDGFITANYSDGLAHHMAFVWSGGSTFDLYYDGSAQLVSYTSANTPTWSGGGPAIAGLAGVGLPFLGTMDEVAIYPIALSGAQVLSHYTKGAGL